MKVLHPAAAALYQIAPSCSWLKTNSEYNIQKEDLWWNVILPVSLFCLITSPILPGACRERERMREEENRHFYCSVLLPCQDRSDHRELRLKHTHTQRERNPFFEPDCPWGQLTAHHRKGEVWPATPRPGVGQVMMPGGGQVQQTPTTPTSQPIWPACPHTYIKTSDHVFFLCWTPKNIIDNIIDN